MVVAHVSCQSNGDQNSSGHNGKGRGCGFRRNSTRSKNHLEARQQHDKSRQLVVMSVPSITSEGVYGDPSRDVGRMQTVAGPCALWGHRDKGFTGSDYPRYPRHPGYPGHPGYHWCWGHWPLGCSARVMHSGRYPIPSSYEVGNFHDVQYNSVQQPEVQQHARRDSWHESPKRIPHQVWSPAYKGTNSVNNQTDHDYRQKIRDRFNACNKLDQGQDAEFLKSDESVFVEHATTSVFDKEITNKEHVQFLIGYVTRNNCPLSGNSALLKVKFGGFQDCSKVLSTSCNFTRESVEVVINEELERLYKDSSYIVHHVATSRFVKGQFLSDLKDTQCMYQKQIMSATSDKWVAVILFQGKGNEPNGDFVPPIDVFDNIEWVDDSVKNYMVLELLLPLNFMVIPHRMPPRALDYHYQRQPPSVVAASQYCPAPSDTQMGTVHLPLLFEMHRLLSTFKDGTLEFQKPGKHVPLEVTSLMQDWIIDTFSCLKGAILGSMANCAQALPTATVSSASSSSVDQSSSTPLDAPRENGHLCIAPSNVQFGCPVEAGPIRPANIEPLNMESRVEVPETSNMDQTEGENVYRVKLVNPIATKSVGPGAEALAMTHPSQLENASMFLRMYGDPLCDVVKRREIVFSHGVNGNWKCLGCSNLNFPRRSHCNKCAAPRDSQGDEIVFQYALRLYDIYQRGHKYTDEEILTALGQENTTSACKAEPHWTNYNGKAQVGCKIAIQQEPRGRTRSFKQVLGATKHKRARAVDHPLAHGPQPTL
ncbi:bifunctional Zinc finger [Babesia duncani]|uniref:Bifunctional Zinc finger n=1 Tax=Babesia duncani TaxID=323732 RepID=A0AAD9UQK4_9APIC|nr:bifunctional Zinc finger [Babesia duncani]